jgi:LysM repeat protein
MRMRATLVAACFLALAVSPAAGATRYTVRWGDTLTGIARAHHVGLLRLARRNGIPVYGVLRAGRVLVIPGRSGAHRPGHHLRTGIYVVRFGDTLTGIAHRHGMTLGALARLNHRRPYAILVIGTRLHVPVAAGSRRRHRHHRRHHAHHHRSHHRRAARPHWRGRYRVQPGDTLSGLAIRFGTTVGRLARANRMHVDGLLLSGSVLRFPLHGRHHRGRISRRGVLGLLDAWAAHYGVDRHLVRAIAWQESGFRPGLTSRTGAWGVMQVMPGTWLFTEQMLIGHNVPRTTSGGIRVGVAYLHSLLDEFGGRTRLAVASYYQGARSVRLFGMFPFTRIYVANVMSLRRRL